MAVYHSKHSSLSFRANWVHHGGHCCTMKSFQNSFIFPIDIYLSCSLLIGLEWNWLSNS